MKTGYRILCILLLPLLLFSACSSLQNDSASADIGSENEASDLPDSMRNLRGAVVNPPRDIIDFSLPSTSGENFTLSDHRGELILLYFGYLSCPDVCPNTFAQLKRAYEALDDTQRSHVKIVFIDVDPERDSLEKIDIYTDAFHKDFIGLRAEPETIQPLMDNLGVVVTRQDFEDLAMGYLLNHTATVFLINKQGQLAVNFLYGTTGDDIQHDIKTLLSS